MENISPIKEKVLSASTPASAGDGIHITDEFEAILAEAGFTEKKGLSGSEFDDLSATKWRY